MTAKNKDIRKVLDAIYVSEKGTVQQADEWDLSFPAPETRSWSQVQFGLFGDNKRLIYWEKNTIFEYPVIIMSFDCQVLNLPKAM